MQSNAATILLAILIIFLCLLPIHSIINSKNKDLFDPRILFSAYIALQLGLYPLYIELTTADYQFVSKESEYSRPYINSVIFYGCLGMMLYYQGFKIGENSNPKISKLDLAPTNFGLAIVVIATTILSIFGFYSSYLTRGFGDYVDNFAAYRYGVEEKNSALNFFCTNFPVTIGILIVNAQIKNQRRNIAAYIVPLAFFLMSIMSALLSGFRTVLLPILISLLALYNYKYRRVTIPQMLASLLILYFASSFYGRYRLAFETTGTFDIESDTIENQSIIQRSPALDVSALIIEKSESSSFKHPGVLPGVYEALTMLIPRKIWLDKPTPQGVLFTEVILNQPNGGVSMSIIGYLFYQGGIVTVFTGMFIFGFGSGFLRKLFSTHRGNVAIETIYISLCGIYPKFAEAPQESMNALVLNVTFGITSMFICLSMKNRLGFATKEAKC